MSAQRLDRVLKCYRIGDPGGRHAIFDAQGSTLHPGRWNTPASPMIYASEQYSTAMLEKLVNGSGHLPPNQHYIEITIPSGLSYEVFNAAAVPDWYLPSAVASKTYGNDWQQTQRSVLLIVPSVVARIEQNFLLNPAHQEFAQITTSLHQPVWWDSRLFMP